MILDINYQYAISMMVIIAVITFALRASSFVLFGHRKMPTWLSYLGKTLPFVIMPTLLLYCLKDYKFLEVSSIVPPLAGIGATALVHIIKKNTIISLIVGTALYMILINIM